MATDTPDSPAAEPGTVNVTSEPVKLPQQVEITDAGRELCAAATASVTAIDFGLVGLDDDETQALTDLLARVRHAAGDFA